MGGISSTNPQKSADQSNNLSKVDGRLRVGATGALATALEQAGVKLKAVLYADGYEPDVIKSPAWKTLQGSYFLSFFRPFDLPNAGTMQMQAAMEKYAHFTKTQFASYSQYEA